ncbi:Polynucleotide 5'-hydroxyl-kinase GRC3 [Cytospora mali]|uniref:Polynucleotide 5'-hydroxyl-kinase GRC3 n=1 Tax=Cytospora mali TaxID=578113 RepID=A0A194VFE9_CYTMA|nr:Polynucleotide 5'-hydroxyl-kinase GRC3 [Valsa mali var. pyri (nom. inval.)]
MSSNKKRKIEVGPGTPMLSAAALRRRLLERQASTTNAEDAASPTADAEINSPSSITAGAEPRRKMPVRGSLKNEASGTFEKMLLESAQVPAADDTIETPETVDDPPKRKVVQLSSFRPTKSNLRHKADGTAVLKLPEAERLVILGSYGVKVKSGAATISGATIYPSESIHWVHAPHCHALPVLRCSEESVIELVHHPGAPDLRALEKSSPIFGNLWNEVGSREDITRRTYQILPTSADGPKKAMLQDLKSPAQWNKKIADLVRPSRKEAPVILVCGPKSSGKSTLSRILINRLVTVQSGTKKRVWPGITVMDIDPGQPEFSPPGVISLVRLGGPNLSPPFCHPTLGDKHILRSHAVASVTPASNIECYKDCVLGLFKHYQKSYKNHPLVINTPGWVQGTGLGLLVDLITEIHPAEVIYMSEDGPEDTVEGLKTACENIAFTTLPSQSSEFTTRTAVHLRHMQAMSYFHVDPDKTAGADIRWNSQTLMSVPPLLVKYNGSNSGILGVVCYGYQPNAELLADAIDGTILAIVEIEDRRAFRIFQNDDVELNADEDQQKNLDLEKLTQRTPENIPYIRRSAPLSPQYSRCLGLALVRGVDAGKKTIALSTPLTPTQLSGKEVVLVSGKFDSPTWAYTEDHYYRVYQREGKVSEKDMDEDDVPDGMDGRPKVIPWTESLHGSQKRAIGSKVWRVRRDLGRNGGNSGD